jgi:hypothetical protein
MVFKTGYRLKNCRAGAGTVINTSQMKKIETGWRLADQEEQHDVDRFDRRQIC